MAGRMPASLDPAVAADHRRGDRDHLHENHLIPGADHRGAGHHQRRPVPLHRPAGRRHQIGHPHRDDRRAARKRRRIRAGQAGIAGGLAGGHGVQGRGAVELHVGLLRDDWLQTPRLLQEPLPYHSSRHARQCHFTPNHHAAGPGPPSDLGPGPAPLQPHRRHAQSPQAATLASSRTTEPVTRERRSPWHWVAAGGAEGLAVVRTLNY